MARRDPSMTEERAREILGLDPGHTVSMLRKAWRRTARRLHPDLVRGETSAFVTAHEAYERLRACLTTGPDPDEAVTQALRTLARHNAQLRTEAAAREAEARAAVHRRAAYYAVAIAVGAGGALLIVYWSLILLPH
jgi:hypothetical protein